MTENNPPTVGVSHELLTTLRDLTNAIRSLEKKINSMEHNNSIEIVKETEALSDFVTIQQLVKDFPTFKESSIRSLIFFENQNNFHKVYKRVGRRIYISKKTFAEWIQASGGKVGTNWSAEWTDENRQKKYKIA